MPQLARRSLSFGEGGLFVALAPGEGASAIASCRFRACFEIRCRCSGGSVSRRFPVENRTSALRRAKFDETQSSATATTSILKHALTPAIFQQSASDPEPLCVGQIYSTPLQVPH